MTELKTGLHYPIKLDELPENWTAAYVGDFTSEIESGFACGAHSDTDIGVVHIRPYNVSRQGHFDFETQKYVPTDHNEKRLKADDVLFNNTNSPDLIGKTAIVPARAVGLAFSNHMTRVAFEDGIEPAFAAHQLHFLWSSRYFLHRCVKHVNQASISTTDLDRTVPFVCPPTKEQRRIVEKIETLFADLDTGVESLTRARARLALYRQSVLKAAFEGRLTADWRAENPDKLEDPDTLLARIQDERAARYKQSLDDWQEVLAKWRAEGEKGRKPAKPKRPKDLKLALDDIEIELPELPDGWVWQRLGFCTIGVEYGTSSKSSETGDKPVVRMGNLQGGKIDWADLVFSSDEDDNQKYDLKKFDVLFNRTNSPDLVGKTAIYLGERPAIFAGYLVRVNQIEAIARAKYLAFYLNSELAKQHGNTIKTDGVNQSNINGNKLQEYPFPFCSVAEQNEIVSRLEATLSNIDAMEAQIDDGLTRAKALRQSILKRAFAGQLVAQDPNDEPAHVLLERIKAEKTAIAPKRRRRSA